MKKLSVKTKKTLVKENNEGMMLTHQEIVERLKNKTKTFN